MVYLRYDIYGLKARDRDSWRYLLDTISIVLKLELYLTIGGGAHDTHETKARDRSLHLYT
jgi:hypothetical protein